MEKKPNFFILGAPKCGTTALYTYLGDHENVFFPELKEPGYFCDDMPGLQVIRSEEEYKKEFATHSPQHRCVGEASVTYLASQNAVRRIREFNPDAKLIAMVRNPVDMIASSHSQLLFTGNENESDLETALAAQNDRKSGLNIPHGCIEPQLLQYTHIASNGAHLERTLQHFPREQLLILTFDDLVADTPGVYQQTLEFLGLENDGRQTFEQVNENKVIRNKFLTALLHDRRFPFHHIKTILKRHLKGRVYRVAAKVYQTTGRPQRRQKMPPTLAQQIYEQMRSDIDRVENLLGRTLDDWHGPERL